MAPKPFEVLMSLSRQPFPDLRCATHGVYRALALQAWGQKLMNSDPGFKEYLLDRSTEHEKEGKEAKFEIVRTLAESPTTVETLGRPYYIKVKEYYNEGPFYVKAQTEVAIEGGN